MKRDTASLPAPDAADLARGDAWAAALDWSALRLRRVTSAQHELFARAYDVLWREFGAAGEMEPRAVIEDRLAWDPSRFVAGHALAYEMLVVLRGDGVVGVCDHAAIVPLAAPEPLVVVHVSHQWVAPPERGSGLGAWLRALPVGAARRCAAALPDAGARGAPAVVVVGEVEPPVRDRPERAARLARFLRAGFRCVDPAGAAYLQPDFRDPAAIDASGLAPLPLRLLLRTVGADDEASLSGARLRAIVGALYAMYGVHQRAQDMAPLWAVLERLPAPGETVPLLDHPC